MAYQKVSRVICGLSALYLLGVAGNSDLGLEPDFGKLALKVIIGAAVCGISAWIGGLMK